MRGALMVEMKKKIIGIPLRISYLDNKKQYNIYSRYEEYFSCFNFTILYFTPSSYKVFINDVSVIVLPGGGDINPAKYNSIMSKKDLIIDDELDDFEFELIELALKKNIPIFGICRGLQLLNVYFKGSLRMVKNHFKNHVVTTMDDSIFAPSKIITNSFHHQAIDNLAWNFTPILISEDKIIEGIIDKKRMLLAVQYHPEINDNLDIFSKFIELFLK